MTDPFLNPKYKDYLPSYRFGYFTDKQWEEMAKINMVGTDELIKAADRTDKEREKRRVDRENERKRDHEMYLKGRKFMKRYEIDSKQLQEAAKE